MNDQGDRNDSPFGNLDASFLVASPAGIFYVAPDMSVSEFRQYFAVGQFSGQNASARLAPAEYPSFAQVIGHALSSIFLDNLGADLERLGRVSAHPTCSLRSVNPHA